MTSARLGLALILMVAASVLGGAPRAAAQVAPPRPHIVYIVSDDPFRAAVRKGEWKLVWQATLPSQVEPFNLAQDPGEKLNLADRNAEKVAELQQRIEALAREAVPPLFIEAALGAVKPVLFGAVVLPDEAKALEQQP